MNVQRNYGFGKLDNVNPADFVQYRRFREDDEFALKGAEAHPGRKSDEEIMKFFVNEKAQGQLDAASMTSFQSTMETCAAKIIAIFKAAMVKAEKGEYLALPFPAASVALYGRSVVVQIGNEQYQVSGFGTNAGTAHCYYCAKVYLRDRSYMITNVLNQKNLAITKLGFHRLSEHSLYTSPKEVPAERSKEIFQLLAVAGLVTVKK